MTAARPSHLRAHPIIGLYVLHAQPTRTLYIVCAPELCLIKFQLALRPIQMPPSLGSILGSPQPEYPFLHLHLELCIFPRIIITFSLKLPEGKTKTLSPPPSSTLGDSSNPTLGDSINKSLYLPSTFCESL